MSDEQMSIAPAQQFASVLRNAVASNPGAKVRMGVVTDVNMTTGYYGVLVGGSSSRAGAYSFPGVYVPVGASCWALEVGNTLLVIAPVEEVVLRSTPVLNAATPPVLSTNGTHVATLELAVTPSRVDGILDIRWGTVGGTAGVGGYSVQLPLTPRLGRGSFQLNASTRCIRGGQVITPHVILDDAGLMTFRYQSAWPVGNDTVMGAANPSAWGANGDRISVTFTFPLL